MFSLSYAALVAIAAWALYRISCIGRRPKNFPPGPPTIPVLGNLHLMPASDPHVKFEEWAKKYGPVYSLMLGTKTMVVLSKDTAVKDLLDKKGAIYSSRPDLYIGQTLASGGQRMLMMRYGPEWRIRRSSHNALHIKQAVKYIPYQELESKQLIYDMMQAPSNLKEHYRRFASSLITSVVFGFRWKTFEERGLQHFFHLFDKFVALNKTGGAAFPDFFPILRYLPSWLSAAQRVASEHHKEEMEMFKGHWMTAKHKIQNKTLSAQSCAAGDLLQMQQEEGFSDEFAAYQTGTFFEAGSDTTSSELYAFAQAMVLYPEVQRRAQAELDSIVGDNRYPNMEDMPSLPYIRACIKETLRWMPTGTLGAAPHATTEDDYYQGYFIPRDSAVVLNVWAINRDSERHPNPARFEPERYLGDDLSAMDSAGHPDPTKRDHFTFGAGRRVCVGMHVAERSMFLAIATTLWAFDITPKKDSDGRPVLPKQDVFEQGFVTLPKVFEAEIKPRSEKRAAYIKEEWEQAKRGLDGEGQYLVNPI
ncbi:cytochrome P450 [Polyplosphaeria fusca]|uniref:Cytochrome P450 n=1 Tax=Polyplosphaeria fusca TaxID=682080 RepID=A0A9P4QYE3_9PLEO|nr:cytochrome P450 [Polyplosphaeria fusca]